MNTGETSDRMDTKSDVAKEQTGRGNVHGGPTWPITVPDIPSAQPPPPVGMNWGMVAERLGVDLRVLEYCGIIVLRGEYFPEAGYFIDPASFSVRFVDVGNMALSHGYFLGEMAMRNFRIRLEVRNDPTRVAHPINPSGPSAPIIGLFSDETQAQRAKRRILQNALASGLTLRHGPLGSELRVERAVLPGRVATVIAGHGGAVISVGGIPLTPPPDRSGPSATGYAVASEQADVMRPGTGVTGESQAPAKHWGGSEQK